MIIDNLPMTTRSKASIASGFILLLVTLGGLDSYLTGTLPPFGESDANGGTASAGTIGQTTSAPAGGVVKQSGPNVADVLLAQELTTSPSTDQSFLQQIVPPVDPVQTMVLLKDGDRVGLLSWVDSSDVQTYFLSLKEALHSSFSPDVRDLIDETQRREGRPTRNFLTFFDPGISPEERFVFVRVRERLYEMRFTDENKDTMFALMEALTN